MTKTHGTGIFLERMVSPGGVVCCQTLQNQQQQEQQVSGSIQMSAKMHDFLPLQEQEAVHIMTRCVKDAFGSSVWYFQVKEVFSDMPESQRLPNSTLPSSHIVLGNIPSLQ